MLIAPNAFKGSLSGPAAAAAMARGVRSVLPLARLRLMPVADGGDGLIDALRAARGGSLVSAPARGPYGEIRRAAYLWIPARRAAVIEMARASGMALTVRRDPLAATSRGVGDLMLDAVRRGARTLVIGMGGAASSDGGAGMARALGARLLDAAGRDLPDGAAALARLARADGRAALSALSGVRVIALSDVTNRLLGPRGSARVFGPQKGASAADVRALEKALARWARVLRRDLGVEVDLPGAGAAGGLGAGLLAFARAELRPGADWVLDSLGADRALKAADWVMTGEGRLDMTTRFGKAPAALARRARLARRPCVVVAGQVLPEAARGYSKAVSFADAGARGVSSAIRRAPHWAAKAAALAAATLALLLIAAPPSRATDVDFRSLDALYFRRDAPGRLEEHLEKLEALMGGSMSGDRDPQLLWRRCRARVRLAERKAAKKERLAGLQAAREDCAKAVELQPSSADARFWHGVAMGKWGQAKGITSALFLIKPIRREMEAALELAPGHGGAHRVLGEMLWQIPGFAGGDKQKALAAFEAGVKGSPASGGHRIALAEAYIHFGRKDDAIAQLKSVAAIKEPEDPAEHPKDAAEAAALLKTLAD